MHKNIFSMTICDSPPPPPPASPQNPQTNKDQTKNSLTPQMPINIHAYTVIQWNTTYTSVEMNELQIYTTVRKQKTPNMNLCT